MQDVHELLKCYANDIKSLPADIHKVIITALDYWLKRAISLADDEDLIFTYRENFLVINIIILLNL